MPRCGKVERRVGVCGLGRSVWPWWRRKLPGKSRRWAKARWLAAGRNIVEHRVGNCDEWGLTVKRFVLVGMMWEFGWFCGHICGYGVLVPWWRYCLGGEGGEKESKERWMMM